MTDMVLGLLAGAGLGAFYFGALWLTVRRIPRVARPGLLVFVSYVARLGVLVAGMYGVVRIGGASALLAALVALLGVRHLAVRRIATGPDGPGDSSSESMIVQEKA